MQISIRLWRQLGSRLSLLTLLLSTLLLPAPAFAQTTDPGGEPDTAATALPGLQVSTDGGAVRLQYGMGAHAASVTDAPRVPFGGYLLPVQTLTVQALGPAPEASMATLASVHQVDSVPFTGELQLAPQLAPPALDWNPDPAQRPTFTPHLPTAPFFLLHEGMQRHQHVAVFAFSSIYQDPTTGELRQVARFDAQVAGAALPTELDATASPDNAELFAPVAALAAAAPPTNLFANTYAVKIYVDKPGMVQVTGKQIVDTGYTAPDITKIRVLFRGVEVPLHITDSNANGKFDSAADTLRFYVDKVGDNYNAENVYWLVAGGPNGQRMEWRSVAAAGAQVRNTAYEPGQFLAPTFYDSTMPGYDGDHFFYRDLRIDAQDAASGASVAVTLTHALPLLGDHSMPTILTVNTTPYAVESYGQIAHRLQIATTGYTYTDNGDSWIVEFSNESPHRNMARRFTLPRSADQWTIRLLKGDAKLGVKIDTANYLLPVQLNFNQKGARFQGVDGTWRYALTSVPANRALYDITDPAKPQLLGFTGSEFQDGPTAKRYLLTGEGTLIGPRAVAAHSPVNMGAKLGAHTLYIAPQQFHAALQPLVDHRTGQKYQVRVVNAQHLYDAWSWGMMDPAAIRSFLQYAVGNWNPAPIAAVLVGDASWDPHNYLGYGTPNLLPAYLLDVDPYIRVTACDNCFGQLNGSDPVIGNGTPQQPEAFLPDIWIGRFPVIDTTELTTIIGKIIAYETDDSVDQLWRRTFVQIADDYIKPDGSSDTAGNFLESIESIVAQVYPQDRAAVALEQCSQKYEKSAGTVDSICERVRETPLMPAGIKTLRHYYMAAPELPSRPPDLREFFEILQSYFTSDPAIALRRTIDLMNTNTGLVTFTGHANHYQWARTETADPKVAGYLLGLTEVGELRNINTPFILLSMTCLSSQFPKPERRHYTLDERLFLNDDGGAVAVWGPAGLSVAHGHDQLQKGFYDLLWKSPRQAAKLGALTNAGYKSVISTGKTAACCIDVNRTFLLLGDPLTPARVAPFNAIQLPQVQR